MLGFLLYPFAFIPTRAPLGVLCYSVSMTAERATAKTSTEYLLFEVERGSEGKKTAKKIERECSVERAASLLQVSRKQVLRFRSAGILRGWQPGIKLAQLAGRDGKNCKWVLCWDSVMEYRDVRGY